MKVNLNYMVLICVISLSANVAYAAIDSTNLSPQGTTQRKLCYQLTIDGVTVSGTLQYFTNSWSGVCIPVGAGGGLGFGAVFAPQLLNGGGNISVSCPAAFPYLNGYTKAWGSMSLVWILPPTFAGGAGSGNVMCCSTSFHLSSMTSSWETPDASGKCSSGI